jgi:hypothetical protein
VAPSNLQTVGKRLFLPHRLRQLFAALNTYYERGHSTPSFRTVSYLHRIREYISSREASLTSASLVPLTEHTLPSAEYEFTTVCENWARSYNLEIFNDLVEPFQTQPAPLVPVQQGGAEVPVHQGSIEPAQQAIDESSYNPPQQEQAAILPNLPAIEGSHQPLGIAPPVQPHLIEPPPANDLDIVLRDPTPVDQAALIPLPPGPPSVEVTLHDCPVEAKSQEITLLDPASIEAKSQEITLLDAAPVEAASKEITFGSAAPPFPPRETSEYAETESTDILDRTFDGLNIAMSPGQSERQPEYNAAMADELQRLRAEMSQLRLARDADSVELQRLCISKNGLAACYHYYG